MKNKAETRATVSSRITKQLLSLLKKACKEDKRTISAYIEILLEKDLQK